MRPTIGRTVHYYADEWDEFGDRRVRAAIVTKVHDDDQGVDLAVFGDCALAFRQSVRHGDPKTVAHVGPFWTWPPKGNGR